MDIELSDDHKSIQENVKRICDRFGDDYWSKLDQIERLFRKSILLRIAPVSEQMIMNFIGEKVLGLPKSY